MKGELGVAPILMLGVMLIIAAVVVLPILVSTSNAATGTLTVNYDTISCVNASTVNLRGYLSAGTFSIVNGTSGTIVTLTSGNYSLSTATYGYATTITYTTLNNTIYGSACAANYTYYDTTYQTNSTNRTLTALIPLLIAIGILALAAKGMGLF